MLFELAYSVGFSAVALTAIIWMAAQVPIEVDTFKDKFSKKLENRVFLGLAPEDMRVERLLYDKSKTDFVLWRKHHSI